MRIGKNANSDPIFCEDLGLKWVPKLKVLGIFVTADPAEMKENLTDTIEDIEKTAGQMDIPQFNSLWEDPSGEGISPE